MAGVQIRLTTLCTSEDYVAGKRWRDATLECCPWHPQGDCGFCRHGTYERVKPAGILIPRWYCPIERRTVSALPDFLASHYSGTLIELEALVLSIEQASSLSVATSFLRTDIELPGALRYLRRLYQAILSALKIAHGVLPDLFVGQTLSLASLATTLPPGQSVLVSLRQQVRHYLPQLPTPLGFNPARKIVRISQALFQHKVGTDPPQALLDPPQ